MIVDPFEVPGLFQIESPSYLNSVAVETAAMGVVLAMATVMTLHLLFTAPYHYPLNKSNFVLQLTAAILFLITTATWSGIEMYDLKKASEKMQHTFPYVAQSFPSSNWSEVSKFFFLFMLAATVAMANITHIHFLTLLFPHKVETRVIGWLLGLTVLSQVVLLLVSMSGDSGISSMQNISECILSISFTTALIVWGLAINPRRAWRMDGATGLFGTAAIVLAIAKTLTSYVYMLCPEVLWLLLVSWALTIWQSWLGFWWWVSAGMGIGEVESRLRRQERMRKWNTQRKMQKKKLLKSEAPTTANS